MKSTYFVADAFDAIACALVAQLSVNDILNYVYMAVLVFSIIMGIVLKIVSAVKDGKVTKQEAEDIQAEVEKALEKIEEEKKTNKYQAKKK